MDLWIRKHQKTNNKCYNKLADKIKKRKKHVAYSTVYLIGEIWSKKHEKYSQDEDFVDWIKMANVFIHLWLIEQILLE